MSASLSPAVAAPSSTAMEKLGLRGGRPFAVSYRWADLDDDATPSAFCWDSAVDGREEGSTSTPVVMVGRGDVGRLGEGLAGSHLTDRPVATLSCMDIGSLNFVDLVGLLASTVTLPVVVKSPKPKLRT